MDLGNIARISETISSIAVVVSLIYVNVQVRQIPRALRATTYNAVASNTIALLSQLYAVPNLRSS